MPPFPRPMAYLWGAYLRMRRRKAGGFNGPAPIEWHDFDAFIRRSGMRLAPWEIEILEAVDDVFISPPPPKPTSPEGQTVKIVAAAGDVAGVRAVLGSVGERRDGIKKKRGIKRRRRMEWPISPR